MKNSIAFVTLCLSLNLQFPGLCQQTPTNMLGDKAQTKPVLKTAIPAYDELVRKEIKYPFEHQLHTPVTREQIAFLKKEVESNFDKRCLSAKDTILKYFCFYSDDGVPVYKLIVGKHYNKFDKFYCEQAIWERISRRYASGIKMTYEFGGEVESGNHPELLGDGDFLKLHLLPQEFPTSNLTFKTDELLSPNNVLKLKKSKISDPRLTDFRLEFFSIITPPTPPELAREKVAAIKKKYSDLFVN